MNNKNKVVVIGCGNVGMSYCYALLNQKTKVDELVLIDLDMDRVAGEVMDLNHGIPFGPSKFLIKAGTYEDCKDASLVVISAGVNQRPGESRLELLQKNANIFRGIVKDVVKNEFKGIFLIATNPVDIMTYVTKEASGFEPSRVMGSGTTLDTARLRYNISKKLNVNSKNVHAYVIGEHGDSEMIPWSIATIGPEALTHFILKESQEIIEKEVKEAAAEIIERKGSTCYGIGMCLVRITNAILGNENTVLTVSSYNKKNDIYIGMPTIVNQEGAVSRMGLEINEEEKEKLFESMRVVKAAISEIKKQS